jgi:hypothetical protein
VTFTGRSFRELTVRLQRADRRRLAFASALTVFALPAVWLANRDNAPARPNVAAVGLAADDSPRRHRRAGNDDASTSVDPMGLPDPLFSADERTPPAPAHVSVAIGTDDVVVATPMATYSRSVYDIDTCPFNGVAPGTTVTVVNPDNGRSLDCVAVSSDGDDLVLHPDRFTLIGDLTTAPIPVEVHIG